MNEHAKFPRVPGFDRGRARANSRKRPRLIEGLGKRNAGGAQPHGEVSKSIHLLNSLLGRASKNRPENRREQDVGSGKRAQSRLNRRAQTGDYDGELASRH